jgi:hypothetical protein
MRFYSVREAKWITIGAQAKKPGTKGANGKKHGGVSVLISDDGTILKGPAHMKGKKPDELGGRQKTLGEKPGEKQEHNNYHHRHILIRHQLLLVQLDVQLFLCILNN